MLSSSGAVSRPGRVGRAPGAHGPEGYREISMATRLTLLTGLALLLALGACPGDDDDTADDDTADDDTADDDTDDDDSAGDDDAGDDDTFPDSDGDGYGADEDCNDYNAAVHPGAEHACDGVLDNDCDGFIDDNETDIDSDGFTECDGDCDDTEETVYPGAYDPVDGMDNDCDGTTDEDVYDCATAPTAPVSQTILPGARGYHGLAIDELGVIVGSDGNALIQSDYAGKWHVFVPGVGGGQQMTYMPDGDLAYLRDDNATIQRITPAGVPSLLTSMPGGYGLIWGPDDMLYATSNNQVMRVDPVTGNATVYAGVPNGTAHSIAFDHDLSRLFISTVTSSLFVVELDGSLAPTGPAQPFASLGSYQDGLAVDVCGHLFVPVYGDSALYRISPTGDVALFVDWDLTQYGHGAIWGNGVGGFREDALYVPLSYDNNKVKEVVVGVPRAGWGGTVLNGP